MIKIRNKRTYEGEGIYVGRPTPLGNPYPIGINGRLSCIKEFQTWLLDQEPLSKAGTELERLKALYQTKGELTLICHCAPLLCHANVIAKQIAPGLTVAGTGHRPHKLGGYGIEVLKDLIKVATTYLAKLHVHHVISGGALGWDTALAAAAYNLGIEYTIAVPFEGQEARWNTKDQNRYKVMLQKAAEVVIVSEGGFSAAAMQRRNEWMVDRCDVLLTMYGGGKGGTYNCINYTQRSFTQPKIINAWEDYNAFQK